jgi:hypothetical protein
MSGKIQFEDEFNYRPQNSSRASYLKTRPKTRLSFTQRLVKSGICKTERSAEKFLLSVAIISFTAGILFTISILNPAIKYRVIFTLEGKHILSDKEAEEYINHKIFDNQNN